MGMKSKSAERASAAGTPEQYLTFTLGEEEYAVDVLSVQEIKGRTAITPIPNSPNFIRGVMNLRGTVVPVIGLREAFGMEPAVYDKFSAIVVLSCGSKVVGLLVDTVADVLDLETSQIEMPPELGARVDTSYITGIAKSGDKFIIVLSIEKIVSGAEITSSDRASIEDAGLDPDPAQEARTP